MPGVRMRSRSTQRRQAGARRGVDQAGSGQLPRLGQRDVGGDRQEQHQPLGPPLARDVADAGVARRRG